MAFEVTSKALVFDTYVEYLLTTALQPGQVMMDNIGVHRPKRVRELIEGRGCELLYLPVYSPDLNPKEEVLSKIMHLLRRIGPAPRRPWSMRWAERWGP